MTKYISCKKTGTFDVRSACAAQKKYCEEKGFMLFAPYDGSCFCGENIYSEDGFTVEEAASKLITYCPRCNRSFLD